MTYLLRKVNPVKWQPNLGLPRNEHSADAITNCTKTTNNTLSVWRSETKNFQDESVEKLMVALALSMDQPAKIDLLWLEEDALEAAGLKVTCTEANTCYIEVNPEHKDIENLNHEKLGLVSEHIVSQFAHKDNLFSLTRPNLIQLVLKWLDKSDTLKFEDLNDKWQKELQKKMGAATKK